MDASQITKLLQLQNTRYINRNQTVDSSTLTWKNQIQSSKYIKGTPTCGYNSNGTAVVNCNVPTNPCCADQVLVNGQLQNAGTYSFGGSGRTTALQNGSPQHFLNVLSGAAGSAAQVYSSESITLQRAGKESCGVTSSTEPNYPANSYVVLPGGDPAGSNAQLQNPSCSYLCTNTNGPVNGQDVPVNNNLNPYLPQFDTYYAMKNQVCNQRVQDQNQKHFVTKCNQCPTETPVAGFINTNPYTLQPVLSETSSFFYDLCIGSGDVPLPTLPAGPPSSTLFPTIVSGPLPPNGIWSVQISPQNTNPNTTLLSINSNTGEIFWDLAAEPFPIGGIYTITYSSPSGSLTYTSFIDANECG